MGNCLFVIAANHSISHIVYTTTSLIYFSNLIGWFCCLYYVSNIYGFDRVTVSSFINSILILPGSYKSDSISLYATGYEISFETETNVPHRKSYESNINELIAMEKKRR